MEKVRKFAIIWISAIIIGGVSSAVAFITGDLFWGGLFAFYTVFISAILPISLMKISEWWEIRQMKKRVKSL